MKANRRAHVASIFFALVGGWALLFHDVPWDIALPNAIFYAVLLVNTYFSIRFFSALIPHSRAQTLIDGLLAVIYVALGLSIGLPTAFAFWALCLFVVASMKYVHVLGRMAHTDLLRKKILIDLWGAVFSISILGVTLLGHEYQAAWTLAIIFAIANVYLLAIRPMYRL